MFCWHREIFSDSQTLLQRTPYHYREFASDNIEKKGDYFQYSVHSRIRAWMNVSIWHKPRSLNEVAHAMLSVGLHDVFPPLPIQLLIRPEDFTLESSSSPVLSPKPPSLRLPLQSHHIHPAPLSLGLNAHARFLYPLHGHPWLHIHIFLALDIPNHWCFLMLRWLPMSFLWVKPSPLSRLPLYHLAKSAHPSRLSLSHWP